MKKKENFAVSLGIKGRRGSRKKYEKNGKKNKEREREITAYGEIKGK